MIALQGIDGHVQLIPHGPNGLRVGLAPADDGGVAVCLAVHTENLGDFIIGLEQFHMLTLFAVCKNLLGLTADEHRVLHAELTKLTEED